MRRPRLTIRSLMLAAAMAGLFCGAEVIRERRRAFGIRSNECASIVILSEGNARYCASLARSHASFGDVGTSRDWARRAALYQARVDTYSRLRDKYARAARLPWLAVGPDPPEPKWP